MKESEIRERFEDIAVDNADDKVRAIWALLEMLKEERGARETFKKLFAEWKVVAQENKTHNPHPWKEYGRTFREFRQDIPKSAGFEIEVQYEGTEEKAQYLVGDVNEVGGSCSCCTEVRDADTVVRYRQVYEKEKD